MPAERRLFWTTADLRSAGRSKRDIALLVDADRLRVVRKGLYSEPDAPEMLIRAARLGGAATASTAASALGVFTPPDDRIHIAVPAGSSRLYDPDRVGLPWTPDESICLHWTRRMPPVRTLTDRVAPLLLVLEHAVRCLRPEYAVAMIDSALHLRTLRRSQLAELAANLPAHLRPLLDAVDGHSDSGVESIARYRLRAAGLDLVVHPLLPGIGAVDLLIGGILIVEIDGREFHTGSTAFEEDRRRDREAALQGYRTLRFSYRQVMYQWDECVAAVRAALALAA